MPVADVKAVLAAPDVLARNALIAAHVDRLEAELAQTPAAVEPGGSAVNDAMNRSGVTFRGAVAPGRVRVTASPAGQVMIQNQ